MAWKTKEEAREYQARWREANREMLRERKRDWWRQKHGALPREERNRLRAEEKAQKEVVARQKRFDRRQAAKIATEKARQELVVARKSEIEKSRWGKSTGSVAPVSTKPAKRKPGRLLALAGWGGFG